MAINCDSTTLQNAITAAASGDTITCNAGSWTWTVPISWSDKRLTITGQPCTGVARPSDGSAPTLSCSTIITVQTGHNVTPLTANICSAANFVTFQHLAFVIVDGAGQGVININCNNVAGYPPVAFRIDHVKMSGDPAGGGRWVMASVYGVVDHCYFTSNSTMGNISMQQDNGPSTPNVYHVPFSFGDNNAMYIENSYLYTAIANQGNGITDNYTGARYVVRFNTIFNNNVGNHGWDSQPRGVPTFEIYNNIFIAQSGVGSIDLFGPRSGTGYVWGNTVNNITGVANGYQTFFTPRYYGALTPSSLGGNAELSSRADGYYPSGTWGTIPYPGTSAVGHDTGIKVTGANPVDGNQFGPGHMDTDYTRTVTDLVTTSGSSTITSATASFVAGDLVKRIYGTNITAGRVISDGNWTNADATFTSATANFVAGDVGRLIGNDASTIPHSTYILSVTNSTTVEMTNNATGTGSGYAFLIDCYLTSITNSTTAVMNCKANASGSGGTLSIGYTNEGYPLADQPGRGYFASANAGNWPNVTTGYTDANYEALMPTYLAANKWQTTNAGLTVLTSANPPASSVGLDGSQGYIKANREWYDPAGSIQTSSSSPFNGTVGTGTGTLANRPATCTAGVGYWALDQGGWNLSGTTYVYPDGGSAYANGVLYKCTATNTWTLYYTPYTYPHPLTGTPEVPKTIKALRMLF